MTDIQQVALSDQYNIDNVMFSASADDTGGYGTSQTEPMLPLGIYQADGVWYDLANYGNGGIALPTVKRDIYWYNGSLVFTNSATVKVAGLGIKGITYDPNNLYHEKNSFIESSNSYMKVYIEDQYTRAASSNETRPIHHGLGYIPMVLVWINDILYESAGSIHRMSGIYDANGNGTGVVVNEQDVYISTSTWVPTIDVTVYYKIYLENQDA